MDKNGGSCWPSTRLLATETGLSERTICTHLQAGRETGFISSQLHGANGQDWASHEYQALMPTKQAAQQESPPQGTEPSSAPTTTKGTEPDSVPQPEEEPKALNLTQGGTEPDDIKALKEVQSSMPVSMPGVSQLAPNGAQAGNGTESGALPGELSGVAGEAEIPQEPKQKKPRPPDMLWEAMLTACGIDPKAKHNDMERGPWNRALKNLRQAGATVEQIPERAEAYHRKFPGCALTPTALARHWSEVASNNPSRKRARVVT